MADVLRCKQWLHPKRTVRNSGLAGTVGVGQYSENEDHKLPKTSRPMAGQRLGACHAECLCYPSSSPLLMGQHVAGPMDQHDFEVAACSLFSFYKICRCSRLEPRLNCWLFRPYLIDASLGCFEVLMPQPILRSTAMCARYQKSAYIVITLVLLNGYARHGHRYPALSFTK